jgi:hypothetical protein
MAYIGQSIKNGTFTDLGFTGTFNSSTTDFNLGTQVGSAAQLLVSKNGVIQRPGTDYTLATGGTQISFTTAPASGDSIFIVEISGAVGGPINSDLNGNELVLDVDGDTSITADTDDQIDIKIGGSDIFQMTASKLDVNGKELILDADADTSITADTDDQIDLKAGGTDTMHVVNGDVRVGTPTSFGPMDNGLKVKGDVSIGDFTADSGSATLAFIKSRNTTVGSQTIVNDGDEVGAISFRADDGDDSNYNNNVARIAVGVDAAPGTNDTPGLIKFETTADGARTTTERMRINSSGAVSIGSTANSGYKLKVDAQGDSLGAGYMLSDVYNQPSFEITNTNTSNFGQSVLWLQCNRTTTNGSYNFLRVIQSGVTDKLFIRDSGNVVNANNSYGAISDLKLKEQITDASSQWSDIKNIQIKKFKFKHEVAEGDSDSLWKLGVIAQEIETVSPSLVETVKDIDKDGNAVLNDEGNETFTKNVKYSVLYMKAVKALQEAITKIETLETEMTALKARVTTLEG